MNIEQQIVDLVEIQTWCHINKICDKFWNQVYIQIWRRVGDQVYTQIW